MTWTSWTTLVPLTILTSLLLVYSSLGERRATVRHLLVATTCALVYAAGYVDDLSDLSPYTIYMKSKTHIVFNDVDRFCEENSTMLLFGAAVLWYAARPPGIYVCCPSRTPLLVLLTYDLSTG